jgi:hypothetical protein
MFTLNERNLMTKTQLTKIQFEILNIICGMMMEGCKKSEAIAYVVLMGYEPEDIRAVARRSYK